MASSNSPHYQNANIFLRMSDYLQQRMINAVFRFGIWIDSIGPWLFSQYEFYNTNFIKKNEKFLNLNTIKIITGLLLICYGRNFSALLIVITAMKITGWTTIKQAYNDIKESFANARSNLERNPEILKNYDRNYDGRISKGEFVAISTEILFKQPKLLYKLFDDSLQITDPNKIYNSFRGIYASIIAIFATLYSPSLKCIPIGTQIGEIWAQQLGLSYFGQFLTAKFKDKIGYLKWIEFIHNLLCKTIAISLILFLEEINIVETFYSSFIGCNLFINGLVDLMIKQKYAYYQDIRIGTNLYLCFFYLLLIIGFVGQIAQIFPCNSLIGYILFGPSLIENMLVYLAQWTKG